MVWTEIVLNLYIGTLPRLTTLVAELTKNISINKLIYIFLIINNIAAEKTTAFEDWQY